MGQKKDGAALLDEYMEQHGLTRERVALKVKTTGATISRLVTRSRGPSIELGLRMQRVLGIPIEAWARKSA
jgi:plasmid maintenance system antidote protein VapI